MDPAPVRVARSRFGGQLDPANRGDPGLTARAGEESCARLLQAVTRSEFYEQPGVLAGVHFGGCGWRKLSADATPDVARINIPAKRRLISRRIERSLLRLRSRADARTSKLEGNGTPLAPRLGQHKGINPHLPQPPKPRQTRLRSSSRDPAEP